MHRLPAVALHRERASTDSAGVAAVGRASAAPGFHWQSPPALTDPALAKGGDKKSAESPGQPAKVEDVAKEIAKKPGDAGRARADHESTKLDQVQGELEKLSKDLKDRNAKGDPTRRARQTRAKTRRSKRLPNGCLMVAARATRSNMLNYEQARKFYANGQFKDAQVGKVGVDVAVCANNLRSQDRLTQTANRYVQGRNCLELGGLWIDEGFTADMKTVVVKAQSDAYFKILEKKPEMKDVFRLGNHLVFVTPSKMALVIDMNDGKDKLTDEEVTALFVAKK